MNDSYTTEFTAPIWNVEYLMNMVKKLIFIETYVNFAFLWLSSLRTGEALLNTSAKIVNHNSKPIMW